MRQTGNCENQAHEGVRSKIHVSWVWIYRPKLTMAQVVVTLKLMPEGADTDLDGVQNSAKEQIIKFGGQEEMKIAQEPIAFGLKSLNITFVMDEEKGSTEELEKNLASLNGVNSVEVTDVRRAIG